MAAVIAVAIQKGGVAKTTTVHTLAEALTERGETVLMIDLNPQVCLTYATDSEPDSLGVTIHDVFLGRAKIKDVLLEREGPDLMPSSSTLPVPRSTSSRRQVVSFSSSGRSPTSTTVTT